MSALFEAQYPSELLTLQVYLLGSSEVRWAGRPLPIPWRQARRLHLVPREHLCFLFWPEIPNLAARRNLTYLLTHLRRALPTPELFLLAEDPVALDAARVSSNMQDPLEPAPDVKRNH